MGLGHSLDERVSDEQGTTPPISRVPRFDSLQIGSIEGLGSLFRGSESGVTVVGRTRTGADQRNRDDRTRDISSPRLAPARIVRLSADACHCRQTIDLPSADRSGTRGSQLSIEPASLGEREHCGCSSMARVPAFQAGYAGSIPVTRSNAKAPPQGGVFVFDGVLRRESGGRSAKPINGSRHPLECEGPAVRRGLRIACDRSRSSVVTGCGEPRGCAPSSACGRWRPAFRR